MTAFRPYPPDWLDEDGAAYLLCLPVSTFREYVADGVLPAGVKIGKHRRWARDSLNASLASLTNPTKTADVGAALRRLDDTSSKALIFLHFALQIQAGFCRFLTAVCNAFSPSQTERGMG